MAQGMDARPHVVIVGAGFGGLTAAQALEGAPVRVTLVDRTNHHTFQPLLYQVAMAGLSPAEIAQPIRAILSRQRNATVLMADVQRVDAERRRVVLTDGSFIDWDFLIVACGATTSYFGHDDWASVAPGLKSIEDAVEIRQRVLLAFELAEREESPARRAQLLSFVVIGGGPTGVELAGALAELSKFVLDRDFRRIDPASARVLLIEAGPRILPSFPDDLSESAASQLRELGVQVRTGARVTSIAEDRVHLGPSTPTDPGEVLHCSLVLWAAGIRANPLTATLGAELDGTGRVLVREDLSVPGLPRVFVIGDAARRDGKDGKPLPGVSPVAMQQARTVARSIRRAIVGRDTLPFSYFDKGTMATIGRRRAVAMVDRMHMSGFLAWLAWLLVHIWYLIGFRSRLVVMITWAWSYFTYRRGARLITGYAHGAAHGATGLLARAPSAVAAPEHVDQASDRPVPRVEPAGADRPHLPPQ
jgi:NADH dehydrogenase